MEVKINLSEMAYRVEHGFHLSNEEARWLLAQVGAEVPPRRRRCRECEGVGEVRRADFYEGFKTVDCRVCNGSGFLPADPVEYVVQTTHCCECDESLNIQVDITPIEDAPCQLQTVELKTAYHWLCEECGRDNYSLPMKMEFAPGEKEEYFRKFHRMEAFEELPDEWEMFECVHIPDEVECQACHAVFKAIDQRLGEEEEE